MLLKFSNSHSTNQIDFRFHFSTPTTYDASFASSISAFRHVAALMSIEKQSQNITWGHGMNIDEICFLLLAGACYEKLENLKFRQNVKNSQMMPKNLQKKNSSLFRTFWRSVNKSIENPLEI